MSNNAASGLYDRDDKRPLPNLFPNIPRYARGPDTRYQHGSVLSRALSTRNTLLQWCLNQVLKEIDRESVRLRSGDGRFVLEKDGQLDWDRLLMWKISDKEVVIAREVSRYLLFSS